MIKKLLALSLIVIPFYEVVLYFLIPGRTYPEFKDMWFTKDFIAMVCSLLIGLIVLYKDGLKPLKEPLLIGFMIFLGINLFKIPNAIIPLGSVNINGIWNHWPVLQCFIYFILFLGVINSMEITDIYVESIINIVSWCGGAMALYMIFQSFGVDQIFNLFPPEIVKATRNPMVGGTIGQPTLSAPFIVMCLPFTILLKRKTLFFISLAGVIVSGSVVAIAAFVAIYLLYILNKYGHFTKQNLAILFGFLLIVGLYMVSRKLEFMNDNGRFGIWADTIQRILKDKIILTGAGLGSYKFLYAIKNQNLWYQAHNEYLQLLFSVGIIGFTLIFLFIKKIFNISMKYINRAYDDETVFALMLSVMAVFICALGTFVFQLAPYQFYCAVFIGLIYKLTREVNYV